MNGLRQIRGGELGDVHVGSVSLRQPTPDVGRRPLADSADLQDLCRAEPTSPQEGRQRE